MQAIYRGQQLPHHGAASLGAAGELAAVRLYQEHFFKVLARNFQNHRGKKFGEVDFVAQKSRHLHFVEVKTRSSVDQTGGTALEAVTLIKQQRILLAAKYFLMLYPQYQDFAMHFDVACVLLRPFDKEAERITIYSDCIVET